nr:MAG TPA: hypothetical protein [Crassvirales sp.]
MLPFLLSLVLISNIIRENIMCVLKFLGPVRKK